jgi:hypothetical protein
MGFSSYMYLSSYHLIEPISAHTCRWTLTQILSDVNDLLMVVCPFLPFRIFKLFIKQIKVEYETMHRDNL